MKKGALIQIINQRIFLIISLDQITAHLLPAHKTIRYKKYAFIKLMKGQVVLNEITALLHRC
ncbi:hypothetical protein D3C73_1596910 [compost metagenome]